MEYIAVDAHKRYTFVSIESVDGRKRFEARLDKHRGSLCQDADTIRFRQEVLTDLLDDAELTGGLENHVPDMSCLRRYLLPRDRAEILYEVT